MANETQDTVPPIQKGQPVQAEPTTTGEAPVPKVKLSRRQFLKGLRDDALVSASMLVAPAIQTPPAPEYAHGEPQDEVSQRVKTIAADFLQEKYWKKEKIEEQPPHLGEEEKRLMELLEGANNEEFAGLLHEFKTNPDLWTKLNADLRHSGSNPAVFGLSADRKTVYAVVAFRGGEVLVNKDPLKPPPYLAFERLDTNIASGQEDIVQGGDSKVVFFTETIDRPEKITLPNGKELDVGDKFYGAFVLTTNLPSIPEDGPITVQVRGVDGGGNYASKAFHYPREIQNQRSLDEAMKKVGLDLYDETSKIRGAIAAAENNMFRLGPMTNEKIERGYHVLPPEYELDTTIYKLQNGKLMTTNDMKGTPLEKNAIWPPNAW